MTEQKKLHDSILVIQVTDSHLFQETDGRLLGIPTHTSLRAVIDRILDEQESVQLVLATGDISQDGSLRSYQYFADEVSRIAAPLRWTAGNHDEEEVLRAAGDAEWVQPVYDFERWRIVMLDSAVSGCVFGHLSEEQLHFLELALQTAEQRHVIVALHHHPVSVGCAWLDTLGLRNAETFFQLLDRYPQVRGVICGHVHQEFAAQRKGVQLLSSPSTCVQFKPDVIDFTVEQSGPGYRWLRLYENGEFATGVSRVAADLFVADTDGSGY